MPESPDFEQIAQRLADALYETADGVTQPRTTGPTVLLTREWYVEQLRQVWNARGAADIAKLEALEVIPDHVSDAAIRSLDR